MPAQQPKRVASKILSEKQEAFVEAKMLGATDNAAAIAAGYLSGPKPMSSLAVKEQLAAARRWLTDTSQIKRLDVIEGFIDGIEMARHLGDPGNVIKGWVEIGKLLGHYAPEVKRIDLTINQQRLRSKFESLSDEELMALSEGATLDGEAEEVE
jgi:hypothetical protein